MYLMSLKALVYSALPHVVWCYYRKQEAVCEHEAARVVAERYDQRPFWASFAGESKKLDAFVTPKRRREA